MIWQNVVLLVAAGWTGRSLFDRERARRRAGRTLRESILPKRRGADVKVPSVTEVAS